MKSTFYERQHSSASFSSTYSFSKVSSLHYPSFSSKSTNYTCSSVSFSTTCFFSNVSSLYYPSYSKSSKALRKQDAIVYESSTDPKVTVEKFFGGLKNYKHNKLLEDLVISGMTVKEFWQCGDKYYMEFECGKLLVPKHVHLKLSWILHVSMG
jgi:hypothetical protein